MTKLAKYIGFALLAVALLLLLSANSAIAAIVDAIKPGAGVWAHLILACVELLAVGSFAAALFLRDKALIIRANPSEEERRAFARELARRLRKNPLVRHLDPEDPHFLAAALAVLNEQADAEIRRTSQRVFLGTALSQNGRLDAIIVFAVLCRMVWRISCIYNQRPHPGEVVSLYAAVASSAFLAFSFEELDLSTEVAASFGEMLHAVAPAVATSAVPFVGSALQKFTASAVDGAANCFLALRAGIITRNAFAFGLEGKERPSRAAVFKEAGGILLSMSNGILQTIAQALKERLARLGRLVQSTASSAAQNLLPGLSTATADSPNPMANDSQENPGQNDSLLKRAGSVVGGTAIRTGQAVSRPFRSKHLSSDSENPAGDSPEARCPESTTPQKD